MPVIRVRRRGLCAALALFLGLVGLFVLRRGEERGLGVLGAASGAGRVEVPILMYHSVLKKPFANDYVISLAALEADLAYLHQNGYQTVVVRDLIAFVEEGIPLPERPVMLSFDDGHYNNYVYGQPLLKEQGFRAVISLVGSYCEKSSESGDVNPQYSYLSWEQVRQMAGEGVFEIQNHSWNLHDNVSQRGSTRGSNEPVDAYSMRLQEDLARLQQKLAEITGEKPAAFTFPFGKISEGESTILREMGFKATLGCQEGVSAVERGAPESLFGLRRWLRSPGRSAESLLRAYEGKKTA
ncbi:MAG: polysaccharide deacetylase family protein [Christensenellaceae bacterium]|jgi:peptidoglycan/xylan/chitin deacetylase (PgdA/CDA1 family)|nr:polysaccharide deacetylase family protein [Christensenellaceae bacterium]